MRTFTDRDGRYSIQTKNISANKTRYVIRNLIDDKEYRTKPYVAGWPFMRSYAEVPVHSPRGMVIGSYCVVDNKPREDFGDSSVRALEEIARLISQHLELMRMRLDYDRAVNLMTGLSLFVDNQQSEDDERPNLRDRTESRSSKFEDVPDKLDDVNISISSSIADGPSEIVPTLQRGDSEESSIGSVNSAHTVAVKVKQTFQRASNLIRESMDLDGCTFFDAYVNGMSHCSDLEPPGLSDENEEQPASKHILPKNETSGVMSSHRSSKSSGSSASIERTCDVLACAVEASDPRSANNPALPVVLLQKLLKRYPAGHIFNVSKAELDDSAEMNASPCLGLEGSMNEEHTPSKRRSQIIDESTLLFSLLPQACSVIFYPLYDPFKNQWCAVCVGWTANTRCGLQDAELTYLAAFSNSIMAELGRLEAVAIGQAKIDFIGNISHELRSPLHGILASAELLQESSTGAVQDQLIGMVDSCGRTLLDTMVSLSCLFLFMCQLSRCFLVGNRFIKTATATRPCFPFSKNLQTRSWENTDVVDVTTSISALCLVRL